MYVLRNEESSFLVIIRVLKSTTAIQLQFIVVPSVSPSTHAARACLRQRHRLPAVVTSGVRLITTNCSTMSIVFIAGHPPQAAIAQLGERQTEDLKVPSSILGLGIIACGVSRLYTKVIP